MANKSRLSSTALGFLRRTATGHAPPAPAQCQQLRTLHLQARLRQNFANITRRSSPRSFHWSARWRAAQPADDPNWISLVDIPQQVVRVRSHHNLFGLAVLIIIPITAFCLGTWQVFRLRWKNDLIARFEDRLVKPPLPLPPTIDEEVVKDFDYRRIVAWGRWRHDQEILVGPRVHDGNAGFSVITPLEREGEKGGGSKILVARGWIAKDLAPQEVRRKMSSEALPEGRVKVEGLLREPFKGNMFTPANKPEDNAWYFPDVPQMAEVTGSERTWVEETMKMDLLTTWDREEKGVPIGRAAEVNLRNNHTQYIFTWYALSLATTIMFWMVVKKPTSSVAGRVRASRDWG